VRMPCRFWGKNGPARCSTKTSPPISRRCRTTPLHRARPIIEL